MSNRLFIVSLLFTIPCTACGAETRRKIIIDAAAPPARVAEKPKLEGHWGEDAVGLRWEEVDSVDGRWNDMDIGPFLASVLSTPAGTIAKGLSVRLGADQFAAIAYDMVNMTARIGWTGEFLKFDPARYGIIRPPQIAGTVAFVNKTSAWPDAEVHYRGMYQHGHRVALEFTVDGVNIIETAWARRAGDKTVFLRGLRVAPHKQPLQFVALPGGELTEIKPHDQPQSITFAIECGDTPILRDPTAADAAQLAPDRIMQPGDRLWDHTLVTSGSTAADSEAPYVVDTLTLPFENPYKALLFVGGHDFFSDGRLAICTLHGDVWIVSGVDDKLAKLLWKRFATGLHQPLGLRIVDDQIYVKGRDQITRLHDRNDDEEADFYENFNNQAVTSVGAHDFVGELHTDLTGNFYYVSANEGLVRVAADGTKQERIAAGWRNPIGLSVGGPDNMITVAPQEGEWTPASAIFVAKPGGWYGYGGPRATADRPLGYDPPLCWIPRLVDNSSGSQVWVDSLSWGPLRNRMLSTSFGRCWMLLTLHDQVTDPATNKSVIQGGVVKMGLHLRSGVLRARFSPHDGQLYVSGMKGWVSSAIDDGCLQRIRYTGQPVDLPIGLQVYSNGLRVGFAVPLDPSSAGDADNYRIQQWNYRYSKDYGSPEYRVTAPRREGRDDVEVQSVTLLDDNRAVFLEINDLQPVMQMSVSYAIAAADQTPMRNTIYHTINAVPDRQIQTAAANVKSETGYRRLSREVRQRLQPGLISRFQQFSRDGPRTDTRVDRMAAFACPADSSPTPFLTAGMYQVTMKGYIKVPLKDTYQFSIRPQKAAKSIRILINDEPVTRNDDGFVPIELRRNHNRLRLEYAGDSVGSTNWRLFWQSTTVPSAPVSPAVLFHDSVDKELAMSQQLRLGRELYATLGCAHCHGIRRTPNKESAMPEINQAAPSLATVGSRLNPRWIAAWLANPRGLRGSARMPHMFDPVDEADQQDILHITSFLAEQKTEVKGQEREPATEGMAPSNVETGMELFERVGCIACHRLTPPAAEDSYNRISLYNVNAKFRPAALVRFLRKPNEHYQHIRMPDFSLTEQAASDLVGFLRDAAPGDLPKLTAQGDPQLGADLFRRLNCQQCHATNGAGPREPIFDTIIGNAPQRGCLARHVAGRGRAPNFGFDTAQRQALDAFLSTDGGSLEHRVPSEVAARYFKSLNCHACHGRDGEYNDWPEILLDESELGLTPDPVPDLTWAGEKLNTTWIERQIAGQLAYRSRPWLAARMPAFPRHAHGLADGFAAQHGMPAHESAPSPLDERMAAIGFELTKKDIGFDCRQCHALDDNYLKLENKANGVGLSYVTDRMRKEFYHRWMINPLQINPQTKMPRFSPDGRGTQVMSHYDGDARKQFEALWQYLRSVAQPQEPTTTPAN